MFKYGAILAIIATLTSAVRKGAVGTTDYVSPLGVVHPVIRCGGFGTPLQLRISGCEGECSFQPGQQYDGEMDFVPNSASESLTLRVEICPTTTFCMQLLLDELPNSSVQPGFIYNVKYSIIPNDILSGETVELRAHITHTDTNRLEICAAIEITIL